MVADGLKNISEVFGLKQRGAGAGRNAGHPSAIVFSNIQRADPEQRTLRVAFGEQVMKEARFLVGDMVTVEVDIETGTTCFRRVSSGENVRSWTLSPNSAHRAKGGAKAKAGKMAATSIRIPGTESLFAWFRVPNKRDVRVVEVYTIIENRIIIERQ